MSVAVRRCFDAVMALSLLDAVRAAVRRYGLLSHGDVVLAAVSGGADSVALVVALRELRAELGITLYAAHLDHGLRGAESTADRAFVEALARDLGVPLTVEATTWNHKVYYPGAHELHIRVTGDRKTGRLLGAQIVGHCKPKLPNGLISLPPPCFTACASTT